MNTDKVLRWLANLSCALEDQQAFCEADEPHLADVSRAHAATAIQGIRNALDQIEHHLDLRGGSPAGGLVVHGSGFNDSRSASPSGVCPVAKDPA